MQGDLCGIHCDWAWGVCLSSFLQYIAGQLITYVILRPMDKISSSQRKNKNRIYILFIFCLSAVLTHSNVKMHLLYPNLHQTVLQEHSLFFYCQQNTLKQGY